MKDAMHEYDLDLDFEEFKGDGWWIDWQKSWQIKRLHLYKDNSKWKKHFMTYL